jgi:hypothetical protein
MIKRYELSCKDATNEAIRTRKKALNHLKPDKREEVRNELKYLQYALENILKV